MPEYSIHFGVIKNLNIEKNTSEIQKNNIEILENFKYQDFNSKMTLGHLKSYFLKKFNKYKYEKDDISVYCKTKNGYHFLTNSEESKISDYTYEELYLIEIKTPKGNDNNINDKYIINNNTNKKINIEQNNNILSLQKENERLKNEKRQITEKYNKEIRDLKQQIEKLKEVIDLKNQKNKTIEDFYDITIVINSIKNINKNGWEVKFNKEGLEKYQKYKNQELIKIGVLGNNKIGKTFILNKISKIKLPNELNIKTEGLSVKYPELKKYTKRNIILIDSTILETPILKSNSNEIEEKKEFKENLKDKIITELFIENFIIDASDILLLIVGELTYSEQILINKIKEKCKLLNKSRLFIIHNLKDFCSIEQVENYINISLLNYSTFNLKQRTWITNKKDNDDNEIDIIPKLQNEDNKEENKDVVRKEDNEINIEFNDIEKMNNINIEYKNNKLRIKNRHFTENLYYKDKKLEVFHLIIANEYSEAGKFYNRYAYNFIENAYNLIIDFERFDIFDKIKNNFKQLSKAFFNENINKAMFIENEQIINKKIIKLNYNNELLINNYYIDKLSFLRTGNFEPKYNYFKPDDNTLEIRIEIPGNFTCNASHEIIRDETIIKLKGIKKKDNMPKELDENIFNIREFSDFEINIPLKVEEFQINNPKPKEGYPKIINGIFCIQYELAKKGGQKFIASIQNEN